MISWTTFFVKLLVLSFYKTNEAAYFKNILNLQIRLHSKKEVRTGQCKNFSWRCIKPTVQILRWDIV